MRTTVKIRGRRGRVLVLLLVAVLGATTAAWSYWSAPSNGSASGHVASLEAPSISGATPGGGTVELTWSAVTAPVGGSVSYYVSRDGGAASSACPGAAAPGTQTSCTDTGVSVASHSYTVTAVWRSWTAKSASAAAQVTSGAATHLVLTPATTTPATGAADNLTITAKDAANNTVTSYSGLKGLTFSGAGTIGSLHPTVTGSAGSAIEFGATTSISFAGGTATVSGTSNGVMGLYKAETSNIKVSDGTINNGTGVSVTVAAGAASSFTLSTATRTAGSAFGEELVAKDSSGNPATSYTGPKTIAFSGPGASPSGKAPVLPTVSMTFTAGTGATSASAITLFDADEAATLTATQGTISGTSAAFAVNAATATSFALASTSRTAGESFGQPITALDGYGNTATSYSGAKAITFTGPATSPGGAAPSKALAPAYPTSVTFTAGVASPEASITLYDAQSTTLTATQGSVKGTSASFTVAAAGAASFTLSTPSAPSVGSAFNETISAKDEYGNLATSYQGTKTIAFSGPTNGPNGEAPKYPAGVSFTAGVSSGLAITLYDAGATTLSAQDGAVKGSTSFTLAAGSAQELELAAASNAPAPGASDNLTITALDAWGNTATSYTGNKSLAFSGASTISGNHPSVSNSSGSSISFGSSTTINFSAGVAEVSGSRNGVMKLYAAETAQIAVSDGTIKTAGPLAVSVSSGALSSLTVSNPGSQTAGTQFNVTIAAKDSFGNPISGEQSLTFSGPAGAPDGTAPSYPASVTLSASGEVKAPVTLPNAASSNITVAKGTVKASTGSFNVSAGPAAAFSLAAETTSPSAGEADELVITAVDAHGNTATSYSSSRSLTFSGAAAIGGKSPTVTSSTGVATAFGTPTSISFTSGVARESFAGRNGVMKLYAAETAAIAVTDGALKSEAPLAVTVAAGTLTTFSVATPATQVAGTPFNLTITAKDTYGNGLSGSQAIAFSGVAGSPSGTAPSYPSSVDFTAGVGTASVTLSVADSSTSVTATLGSAKASTANFAVNAGAAAKLAWSGASSSTGEAEGLCLFTCTWGGFSRSHSWSAKVSVTDTYGNSVSNIGSGHTVTWTGGPSAGTVSPVGGLALPTTGVATTSSSVTYTSSGFSWTSDTFTAHTTGYGDATVLLKR